MSDIFCPMIHGGLVINTLHYSQGTSFGHCCLRPGFFIDPAKETIWNNKKFTYLRDLNDAGKWDNECWICQGNELAGKESFRTGTLKGFGQKRNLSGPVRLDLVFDNSCNLACRSCWSLNSTFWLKHLIDNNLVDPATPIPTSKADEMIKILKSLDLSNLELVLFCGGETLLGNTYWRVAEAIADMVPNAKQQLTMSFQSNGTQSILERHHSTIDKFKLVKIHFSLDGIKDRFEYLRWPANWNQVVENMLNLREALPSNVMFLIEETMGCLNLFYNHEVSQWAKTNFAVNRFGDITNHTTHHVHGFLSLDNLTQEYIDALPNDLKKLVKPTWKENAESIQAMIREIEKFDKIRNENWAVTFPEVYEFYKRYH